MTAAKQAQRNSMLSGMFSFMKRNNKIRKNNPEGLYLSDLDAEGMDPEIAALYFPDLNKDSMKKQSQQEEDRESGNGTSLPQSPTSMDCSGKNLEVEPTNFIDLLSLSLCGGIQKGGPTEEEFQRHAVHYEEVCQNPALFASPNLVVKINSKYYSWSVACPLVMSYLAFQKPLPNVSDGIFFLRGIFIKFSRFPGRLREA